MIHTRDVDAVTVVELDHAPVNALAALHGRRPGTRDASAGMQEQPP